MDDKQLARFGGPVDRVDACPFKTEREVEQLAYRETPYWHHLLVGRHIGIHRPDGRHCNWIARLLTKDRRYVQRCLGSALSNGASAVSYAEAIEAAFSWFSECDGRGESAERAPRGRTDGLNFCPIGAEYSVGHALTDYLQWSKIARSAGGHYNTVVLLNHHLSGGVTHRVLAEFTAADLQEIALKIIRTPPRFGFQQRHATLVERDDLTPDELRRRKRTYNSVVGILRMAFQYAWENGKIGSDRPLRCLKRISVVHTPRLLFLNRDECRRLLDHCTPALRDLTLAALYTGCRVGELASLRVEDVGYQIFGLRIAAFKRSPSRYVFLPDEGMAFFLRKIEGKEPKDLVFRSEMGKAIKKQHASLFRRAVSRAGLPDEFVFHGLRHTYASDLIRQGVPLEVVARQLGHADIRTVSQTYGHIAEQFREEQIRTRFSPLDDEELKNAKGRAGELDELWHRVKAHDWRSYAQHEVSGERRVRSNIRTPASVLEVFEVQRRT
ncbi:site-specific integrase [Gemmobacter straminiformis]|uniref:Site-specific integrase n=1 Tax=Paragemmobacter straminiformis TaxID=2045119 RepID=A0A842IEG5_9RHOB|nr:site-specific integrase [Gemmobacter straminiformis]